MLFALLEGIMMRDVMDITQVTVRIHDYTSVFKILVVFNLVDSLFTLFYVNIGVAVEANPILNYYYSIHPSTFVVAKNILFCGSIYILSRCISFVDIRKYLKFIMVLYMLIIIYHVASFKAHGLGFVAESTKILMVNLGLM